MKCGGGISASGWIPQINPAPRVQGHHRIFKPVCLCHLYRCALRCSVFQINSSRRNNGACWRIYFFIAVLWHCCFITKMISVVLLLFPGLGLSLLGTIQWRSCLLPTACLHAYWLAVHIRGLVVWRPGYWGEWLTCRLNQWQNSLIFPSFISKFRCSGNQARMMLVTNVSCS